MARMPDGWVVTTEADGLEVRLKESRELVMCKSCKYHTEGGLCTRIDIYTGKNHYCASGERRDSE